MTAQFHWDEADFVSAHRVWLQRHPWAHLRGYEFPVAITALSVAMVVFKPEAMLSGLMCMALALLLFGFGAVREAGKGAAAGEGF